MPAHRVESLRFVVSSVPVRPIHFANSQQLHDSESVIAQNKNLTPKNSYTAFPCRSSNFFGSKYFKHGFRKEIISRSSWPLPPLASHQCLSERISKSMPDSIEMPQDSVDFTMVYITTCNPTVARSCSLNPTASLSMPCNFIPSDNTLLHRGLSRCHAGVTLTQSHSSPHP